MLSAVLLRSCIRYVPRHLLEAIYVKLSQNSRDRILPRCLAVAHRPFFIHLQMPQIMISKVVSLTKLIHANNRSYFLALACYEYLTACGLSGTFIHRGKVIGIAFLLSFLLSWGLPDLACRTRLALCRACKLPFLAVCMQLPHLVSSSNLQLYYQPC